MQDLGHGKGEGDTERLHPPPQPWRQLLRCVLNFELYFRGLQVNSQYASNQLSTYLYWRTGVFTIGPCPPPSAEKMFTFDMLNFEKLGCAPPPQRSWPPPLSEFLDTPLYWRMQWWCFSWSFAYSKTKLGFTGEFKGTTAKFASHPVNIPTGNYGAKKYKPTSLIYDTRTKI